MSQDERHERKREYNDQPGPRIAQAKTPPPTEDAADAELRAELDRRLCVLATYPAATFGPLSHRDLIFTIVIFVLLPLSLVWVLR